MAYSQQEIEAFTDKLNEQIALYRSSGDKMPANAHAALGRQVADGQRKRSEMITDGCPPCPSCGSRPIGMHQVLTIDKQGVDAFEVGCPQCSGHRAKGLSLDEARVLWAAGPSVPAEYDANGVRTKRAVRGWCIPTGGTQIERTAGGIVTTLPDKSKIHWAKLNGAQRKAASERIRKASPVGAVNAEQSEQIA